MTAIKRLSSLLLYTNHSIFSILSTRMPVSVDTTDFLRLLSTRMPVSVDTTDFLCLLSTRMPVFMDSRNRAQTIGQRAKLAISWYISYCQRFTAFAPSPPFSTLTLPTLAPKKNTSGEIGAFCTEVGALGEYISVLFNMSELNLSQFNDTVAVYR